MADGGKVIIKIDGDTKGFEGKFDKLKSGLGTAAKAVGASFVAAGAAIGKIGTEAVKAYSNYEQLVGGVETLFGVGGKSLQQFADDCGFAADEIKDVYEEMANAPNKVLENAKKAYQTAGLSANQYMETVTGFSASLLQSLAGDTAKAAEYADQAVIDMSDNANKMGTSMEMIQYAYQGFAKQNYTMLDNLKLGYGGTKEEMARLLADAEKISGIKYDMSSFADITQAIHVIQTEMGITGTTAEEAATTIQGSLGMTKAAWENLMTGLADPDADIGELLGQFIDSAETFGENLIPAIERVLQNLPSAIADLGGKIAERLPAIVAELLPAVTDGAAELINAIVAMLPGLLDAIISVAPNILGAVSQLFGDILAALPGLISSLMQLAADLLPMHFEVVLNAILSLAEQLPNMVSAFTEKLPEFIQQIADSFVEYLPLLIEGAVQLILALVEAIPDLAGAFAEAAPILIQEILEGLIGALPVLIAGIIQIISELPGAIVEYLSNMFKMYSGMFLSIFSGIWEGLKAAFEQMWAWLSENCPEIAGFFTAAWDTIKAVWNFAAPFFTAIWETIKAVFSVVAEVLGGFFETAWTVIKAVWDTVTGYFSAVWETIKGIFAVVGAVLSGNWSEAWEAIKGIVGAWASYFSGVWNSIKTVFSAVASWFGNIFKAAWNAIKSIVGTWANFFKTVWNGIKSVFSTVGSWFKSVFTTAVNGIKSVWGSVTSFFSSIWEKIKAVFKPSAFVEIGKNLLMGLWNGINDKVQWLKNKVAGVVNKIKSWFTGKDGFDTHSPSKWSKQVFAYVIDGAVEGIEENKSRLFSAVKSLVEDTRSEVEKVQDSLQPVKVLPSELVYAEETQRINNDESKTPERIAYEEEQTRQKNDDSKTWEELFYEQEQEHFKYDNVATQERVDYEAFKKRYDEMESEDKEKYKADLEALKEAAEKADKEQERAQEKYLKGLKEDADKAKNLKKRQDDEYLASLKDKADKADKIREDDNKKYLDGLKETAEAERKLFDARQKDIENAEKRIYSAMQDFAEKAKATLEEVEKAQSAMAKKLKDYGDLYVSDTFKLGNLEYEVVGLANLESQTKTLQEYAEKLTAVKERGEIPEELFGILRDLSVDEGIKFADALLNADDETFNKYLQDWQNKQNAADNLSKVLYDDDAQKAQKKIDSYREEFDAVYKDNFDEICRKSVENAEILGETWTDTFTQGVMEGMNGLLEMIKSSFASFVGIPQYAMAGGYPEGGGSTVINNYNITAKDESAKGQMDAIQREQDYRDMN